ncbi:hypothetical protein NC652_030991 [Populus alba x Populus x berolinensis]|uniref:Uncharacterized protein n=1 Tax=Populus alba x Populus x berolinensis TaxID=444605 RepID=A0AAD6LXB8_9ROSI|nr:hypothetical protein NC652_030991 [Populus alba x Populus x berolinensis]KAJ6974806.1 hypothetical protein NC653_030826 [Populus alba x Populus x berolinensis]
MTRVSLSNVLLLWGWLAQTKTHSRPIRLFPQLNVQHSAFHLDGLKRRHLF